jgi:hypothetical protein
MDNLEVGYIFKGGPVLKPVCQSYWKQVLQSTSEIQTVQISKGHFLDTFWVHFSNAKIGHLVSKTDNFCPVFEWSSSLDHFINKWSLNFFAKTV